ncbi:MAG TPA: IS630 family transposase [Chloroflexota bacterium]|nr:IS630 family transposase [Chloroflexota bacterium]
MSRASLDWRTDRDPVGHRKADRSYDQALDKAVEKDPRELGRPFSTWTRASLGLYLAEKLKVTVSESTVGRHLRRLGWTLSRPVLSIRSHDPEYVAKAAELELLKSSARQGDIILLYEDEVDLNLLPGVIRCWTRLGEQRKVFTPGTNKKRYGFGAVDFTEGTIVTHLAERKNGAGFCQLIEAIVARYCPEPVYTGPKVVLVIDNYVIHKSKLTQATLDKHTDRLELFALPSYSPKLNVIERLWKYLHARVTHNHLFGSIEELLQAVLQFLGELAADKTRVLSVIGGHRTFDTARVPENLCSVI